MLLALTLCARAPVRSLSPLHMPVKEICPEIVHPVIRHDICYTVAPGETLWRLSKMYDVTIEDIMRANNLKGRDTLEMGQRVFIPQAAPLKPVVHLYPTNKWKYIIIYNSATDEVLSSRMARNARQVV